MSRRNHLHDEMCWRTVGMLKAGASQSAVARKLNVHRSVIHRSWNHYQRDQSASRGRGSGRRRITTTRNGRRSLPVAMCQTPEDTNRATAGSRSCRKAHFPPNYVAQTA
ncbi:hypothetical protein AVEN_83404-1 [Araneus ventricosus]|uniref:Transposase IS30-like HTH domain-containing protein n=1 Tax=Araneus ventricosus TaxID=182803 RepID=A0A4Y2TMY1_ARAVE|nr:hypothetical protein AVEN_260418-1 [Araneus ventricosus]GBO01084.1 hypothetical protein AVEN_83404-1 [Araneus ventricosus]